MIDHDIRGHSGAAADRDLEAAVASEPAVWPEVVPEHFTADGRASLWSRLRHVLRVWAALATCSTCGRRAGVTEGCAECGETRIEMSIW